MAITRRGEGKNHSQTVAEEKIASLKFHELPRRVKQVRIAAEFKGEGDFQEFQEVALVVDRWMKRDNPTMRAFFSGKSQKGEKVGEVVIINILNGHCYPPTPKNHRKDEKSPAYDNQKEVAAIVHVAIEPAVELLLLALPEREERPKPRPERPALKVEPEAADEPEAEDTEPDTGNGDTGEDANGNGDNGDNGHEEVVEDVETDASGNGDEGEAEADPETPADDAPTTPEHLCFRCGKALSPERIADLQARRIHQDRWDHQECYLAWRSAQKAAKPAAAEAAGKDDKADNPKGGKKPEGKKAKS